MRPIGYSEVKTALFRGLVVAMLAGGIVSAQPQDPKTPFLQALGLFTAALEGSYGDEGRIVRSTLDAMDRALMYWDAALEQSTQDMTQGLRRADPHLVGRMHVALGAGYLDRGRIADAVQQFEAAIEADPSQADVHFFKGLAHAKLHKPDAAADELRKAVALDSKNLVYEYFLGRQLVNTGSIGDAKPVLQKFYEQWSQQPVERGAERLESPFIRLDLVAEGPGAEPFFPPALYVEGYDLIRNGDFRQAITRFRESVDRDPLVVPPVEPLEALGLAASALKDGSLDRAIQHLKVAVELEPTRAEARRMLGRTYLAERQDQASIDELGTAARLNPKDERARLTLARALIETHRYPDAERELKDALIALPASGAAHYALGRLYQRQGEDLKAVPELEAAAAHQPFIGLNSIYQKIGMILTVRASDAAAADAYGKRVDLIPNDVAAHQDLGKTYERLGRTDEALAEFAAVLMLNPDDADAYADLGRILLEAGRGTDAEAVARRAAERNPTATGTNR